MWPGLLEFLKAIWPSLAGALKLLMAGWAGSKIAAAEVAENDLNRVEEAMRAAVVNSARSVDDRLRDAKQRGLYRVPNKSADDK